MASERNGTSRRFFKHPRASALRLTIKFIIDSESHGDLSSVALFVEAILDEMVLC